MVATRRWTRMSTQECNAQTNRQEGFDVVEYSLQRALGALFSGLPYLSFTLCRCDRVPPSHGSSPGAVSWHARMFSWPTSAILAILLPARHRQEVSPLSNSLPNWHRILSPSSITRRLVSISPSSLSNRRCGLEAHSHPSTSHPSTLPRCFAG